ncbi:MAG: hypothetical protein ACYS0E_19295 [Planctomycetota bacterium]
MDCVTLAGTQGLSWRLQTALVADGWQIAPGSPDFRILCDAGIGLDEVPAQRDFVLGGGRLLAMGGEGPLLARLHLTPEMGQIVEGEAESFHPGFPSVRIRPTHPVHGVGYAFLRVGDVAVALGGPRGAGFFVYLAETDPHPDLVLAAMGWLREPGW